MEESAPNTSELEANASETTGLPELAVIFAPVLLVQLLVGLVSNILLIALLVKASSVNGQNNVNIYLYTVAINNLLSLFLALTLLISIVTKEWVLGQTMCSLNQFVTYEVGAVYVLVHVCISRERYRAIAHFSKWMPYSRAAYVHVGVVWISSVCFGVIGLAQGGQIAGETDDVLSCYAPNRWFERRLLPLFIVFVVGFGTFISALLVFASVHYARALRELYIIKDVCIRSTSQPMRLNQSDIPISWKAEVRILKSVAFVFFVSVVPFVVGYVYYMVVSAVAIGAGKRFPEVNLHLLHIGMACVYYLPTASPLLLIVINKRFRTRMKDLLRKWQLKPTNAIAPYASSRNKVVTLTPAATG